MLKMPITFDDLDGNPVTQDFYFNLTKAELAEMFLSEGVGFEDHLRQIIEAQEGREIIRVFKEIISLSVGIRSEDNLRFEKSKEISANFMQTDAYNVLFMSIITDSKAMADFVNGTMPKDFNSGDSTPAVEAPPKVKDYTEYTEAELIEMPHQEFVSLVARSKEGKSIPQALLVAGFNRTQR